LLELLQNRFCGNTEIFIIFLWWRRCFIITGN